MSRILEICRSGNAKVNRTCTAVHRLPVRCPGACRRRTTFRLRVCPLRSLARAVRLQGNARKMDDCEAKFNQFYSAVAAQNVRSNSGYPGVPLHPAGVTFASRCFAQLCARPGAKAAKPVVYLAVVNNGLGPMFLRRAMH